MALTAALQAMLLLRVTAAAGLSLPSDAPPPAGLETERAARPQLSERARPSPRRLPSRNASLHNPEHAARIGPRIPGNPFCYVARARWCKKTAPGNAYCTVYCNTTADFCGCSGGCTSSWKCKPSHLCTQAPASGGQAVSHSSNSTTVLGFLSFNRSLVRKKYANNPKHAFERELQCIHFLVRSMRAANSSLPFHVVVSGHRNAAAEESLREQGVRLIEGQYIQPPRWASAMQKQSFNKIFALALTQFKRVSVQPVVPLHLPSIYGYDGSIYDGGDQAFWKLFYPFMYELPTRYHAHQSLEMSADEWRKVHVLHIISGLRDRSRVPTFLKSRLKYFY
ncbi:hypothetical protein AB1Y20_000383 [Prymnesium parvum]|uniref:Uncharacterized protein n=1 Tax=Prymnesium parvum TaxID=97485 RepID=A0AB34K9X9_PRYPA